MMKTLGISLSAVIMLNILSQLSSILFVRVWGNYSDRFSNKTVIRVCAPMYIACILGWTFLGNYVLTIPLLIVIHVISGISTGGINLSITNIGLKLASKDEAMFILPRVIWSMPLFLHWPLF